MQDNRENLAIGVLSITATILLVGVILALSGSQNQALAFSGGNDRGGDYVMATGQFSSSTDLVFLTDAAANRLNIYGYDRTQRELRLFDTHDLKKEFGEANQ
ncbi:MAG TPA: hypothetical protein VMV94_11935 [Phycisphaerae bacterium]|nr:hypothetical protein [Phycisphaerae bacterium]